MKKYIQNNGWWSLPWTDRRIPPQLEREKKKGDSEHGGWSYDWRDEIGARQKVENEPPYVFYFLYEKDEIVFSEVQEEAKKKKVRRLTDQNQANGRSYWISWLKLEIRSVLEIVWVYYLSSISFIYKEVNEKEVDHCIGNTHRMQNKLFYLELILCRSVCIRQWEFI